MLLGCGARVRVLIAGPAVVAGEASVGVHHGRDRRALERAVDVLGEAHVLETGTAHDLLSDRLQEHQAPVAVLHVAARDFVPIVARPHPGGVEVELQGVVGGLGRGVHHIVHEHRLAGGDGDRDRRVDPRGALPDGAFLASFDVERDAVTGGDRGVVAHIERVRSGRERDVGSGASDHLPVDDDVRGIVGPVDHRPDVQVAIGKDGRRIVAAARIAAITFGIRFIGRGHDLVVARAALAGAIAADEDEAEEGEDADAEDGTH